MKYNFQNDSFKEKDLYSNDTLNTNNIDFSNNYYSPTFNKTASITIKKNLEKRNTITSNYNKKESFHLSKYNTNILGKFSPKNKSKTFVIRKNDSNSLNNKDFLNYTDYNLNKKDYNEDKIKKIDKMRIFRRINKIYDSFDDDESEKDDDFDGNIILPNSNIIFILYLFLTLSCFYCLFYIPLRMAKSICFCNEEYITNKILLYFVDILYICDLCISFFLGYYNYQFKLVKNKKKIFYNYLKTFFLFDFLTAITIFSLSNFLCSNYREINNCFRYNMPSFLIWIIIFTNIKILKILKVRNKKRNIAFIYFLDLFSENFSLEKTIDNSLDLIFCFLGFHFFVCLNIFLSRQAYPNWIIIMNIQDQPLIYIYLSSCYSLIETLTTVGYGDVVCQCLSERVLQIIILSVGVIAYSYLISQFGNMIKNESQSSIKYNNNMKILEEIRIDYPNMTYKLYNKIYNHIESRNASEKKLDENILVNALPFNLRNSILLVMYRNIIKNFKFFKKCENSNFIIEVLSKFVPVTSKKNEFVLFEGEMIEDIIFVKDGRLSLEAAIDMEDQQGSLEKYFFINFQGITTEKEMKKLEEKINSSKMLYYQRTQDFDKAKNILNTAVKKQVNYLFNEAYEDTSILDRTKFGRKENFYTLKKAGSDLLKHGPIKNEEGNYKYIKVLDIRKNENFGGLYMFLRRPSPLSLKVRTKIAEL